MATSNDPTQHEVHRKRLRDLPLSTQWRAALVRIPRLTPLAALKITCPQGPYPFIAQLPSRSGEHAIPLYIWLPSAPTNLDAVPVHIDFHGGGFIMGGAVEQGPFCARLCRERHIVVLCVDYCQGPRYEFPAAIQDAEDVLSAVLDVQSPAAKLLRDEINGRHIPSEHSHRKPTKDHSSPSITLDPNTISISGFSSGGNLALNLALSTTGPSGLDHWPCLLPSNGTPVPIFLFYPSFDQHLLPHERPLQENTPKPGPFSTSLSKRLYPTYLPADVRNHIRANPGLAPTSGLSDRARIFLVLADIDTLAVQSNEWVQKMQDEGHADHLVVYKAEGMEHGWCNIPDTWLEKKALAQKEEAYRRMMRFWDETLADDGKAGDCLARNWDPI